MSWALHYSCPRSTIREEQKLYLRSPARSHGSGPRVCSPSPGPPTALSYRGAGFTDGLTALQMESRDGPHLDGAVAGRAHVNHQILPRLEPEAPRSGLPAPDPLTSPLTSAPQAVCLMGGGEPSPPSCPEPSPDPLAVQWPSPFPAFPPQVWQR